MTILRAVRIARYIAICGYMTGLVMSLPLHAVQREADAPAVPLQEQEATVPISPEDNPAPVKAKPKRLTSRDYIGGRAVGRVSQRIRNRLETRIHNRIDHSGSAGDASDFGYEEAQRQIRRGLPKK